MNRLPCHHPAQRRAGGKPSGRAAAFDRWLPFLAGGVGRQGGWAAEALTTRRSRCTKLNRSSAADRPPTAHDERQLAPGAQRPTRAVTFTPKQHSATLYADGFINPCASSSAAPTKSQTLERREMHALAALVFVRVRRRLLVCS